MFSWYLFTYRNPSSGFVSGSSSAGFHSPESTQRFMWYLASFSPNFLMTSCNIAVSCSSKHLQRIANLILVNIPHYYLTINYALNSAPDPKYTKYLLKSSGKDSKTSIGSSPPGDSAILWDFPASNSFLFSSSSSSIASWIFSFALLLIRSLNATNSSSNACLYSGSASWIL